MLNIYKFENTDWHCLDCRATGNAEIDVPKKCPECGSPKIDAPLIKKGGPLEDLELKIDH